MRKGSVTDNIFLRSFAMIMSLVMTFSTALVLCGCGDDDEKDIPADYGKYGSDIAREIAKNFPYRIPYSGQETSCGSYIEGKIKELGYSPEVQEFHTDKGTSHNYIVRIQGKGFYMQNAAGEYVLQHPLAIIGAHYDSSFDEEGVKAFIKAKAAEESQAPESTDKKKKDKKKKDKETEETQGSEPEVKITYDGLSDNASGVGCLLTALAHANEYKEMGYDVIFAFFGAGNDGFAGAKYFLNSLSAEDKALTEVMYCVDSIYAGSKVYASAGVSSVSSNGNKYELRRKLYKTYDVCYRNTLYSNYRFDICYNESDIYADVNGDGSEELFAEISHNKSDYIPFDNAKIPVVYIESYDYNFDTIEEMKDTKNLNLKEYDGIVRGTPLDSTAVLDPVLVTEEKDLLEVRINCIAFVMLETIKDGTSNGMTEAEYKAFLENQKRGAELAESAAQAGNA
ncbi:MAG: M28 family peptidase [Clostridiales bacterium]|nr:M28 family peptidase [Clostridiales bacterium]